MASDGRTATAAALAVDQQTAAVVRALDGAGIDCLLLKGPTIARWLYTDGAARGYSDTDLLVSPDRFDAAADSLRSLGFESPDVNAPRYARRPHAETFRRAAAPGSVDLHWTFHGVGDRERLYQVAWHDREPMVVAGVEMWVCSVPMRALLLTLHVDGGAHGSTKPVDDLCRAVETLPAAVWAEAARLAEELHSDAAMALGLALVSGGESLANSLGLDTRSAGAAERIRQRGAVPQALSVADVVSQPTWRRRARLAVGKVVPPPSYVRQWDRAINGRSSRSLAGAYVRRLFMAVARGPAAVAAYVRAQRR